MQKRILYQAFLVTVVALVASTVFYYVVCAGLKKTSKDVLGKLNFVFNDTTYYSAFIIGPSNAHLGFSPAIFDSATNHRTNTFNACTDGARLVEMNFMIHKLVKSHGAPKDIYLNFTGITLATDTTLWNFAQYYPFINDPDFASAVVHEPKLCYGKYAPFFAVTYFNDPLRSVGMTSFLSHKPDFGRLKAERGYLKSEVVIKDPPQIAELGFRESDDGWNILDETVNFCAEHKIRLHFLITPLYNVTIGQASKNVLDKLQVYAGKHDIEMLNFLGDNRFESKLLFADRNHLNSRGAFILTNLLATKYNQMP